MSITRLRGLLAIAVLLVSSSLGCWEQNLPMWFPQMKRQPTVQAFEMPTVAGHVSGLLPAEGSVPVGAAAYPDLAALSMAEQDALPNPTSPSMASLNNGEEQYVRFCAPCHGVSGLGDGPVAGGKPFPMNTTGPFTMVLPVAGPTSMAKVFSDGHIYTTISLGRGRMPNYRRIQPEDRWDIVNYIREINTEKDKPVSAASQSIEKANPRSLPQPLTSICAGAAGIGVLAFIVGIFQDPQSAWLAFHTNFVFFATLSQAGMVLACIFVIVDAKWPGPLRRLAEGLAAWIPISFLLLCVGYFGGDYIFEWKREGAIHGKEPWLNPGRVYGSNLAILGVLTALSLYFLKTSVRPLLGDGAMNTGTGFAKGMAEKWTQGWKGYAEERAESKRKLERIAPLICLIYGIGYSLFAFDQVMSIEQTWFSNLFGAYVAWGGILSAVAATAVLAVLHRNAPGFQGLITEKQLHDIGKMVFAFSIFWFYLYWAQYLVIYYGNLPEETRFFADRLGSQFVIDKGFTVSAWAGSWGAWDFKWSRFSEAYGWLSMVVWLCLWIIPFWVLLGQRPKMTPWILGPVSSIVLLGFWLERNLLIWPSVVKDNNTQWAGPIPLAIGVGFIGAYILVYLIYSRVFPSIGVQQES